MNFKEWWQKPVTREDRIVAVVISAIGGAIIGFIARIYFGSVPTPLLDYVIWAALGFFFCSTFIFISKASKSNL